MRTVVVVASVVSLGVLIASCGGGGGGAGSGGSGGSTGGTSGGTPGTVNGNLTNTSPALEDGSKYVVVPFTAKASGTATVTAGSSSFDAVLSIEKTHSDGTAEVVAEDDDSGGGTNASATFSVTAGARYQAVVTGVAPGAAGAFTVTYTKETLGQ